MDRVLAVRVETAPGTTTEHLAHQVRPPLEIVTVDAGVSDRLLVGGHPAVHRLGDHAGEHTEQPQDHEGAGVGRSREHRSEQRAWRRKPHLDERHDALVDVQLGHPLRRLGEVAQDRRQPLLQEHPVAVVAAVVDRALRLRRRATEVEDQPLAVRVVGSRAGERDPLRVQHRLVDPVVLGVVLPDPLPHGDLGQDLAPVRRGRAIDDRVEAGLDRVHAVAVEQLAEPARAHQAGRALRVEVGAQRLGHPRVAGHDAQRRPVGDSRVPQPDRRDHQPLLEDAGRAGRHRTGYGAADVVVVAERLDESHHATLIRPSAEDRDRHTEVGQMADAALGSVDVVVEEDVALLHLLDREVACNRVHQRAVGAAGQLAQQPVVDAGTEVVCVPDHRASRGAPDRGLDLHLDGGQRALDDLHQHRVGTRTRVRGQVTERELRRCAPAVAHDLVTMMLSRSSIRAMKPGCSGTVEPNSSMIAGPVMMAPTARSGRHRTGVSTYPSAGSKQTCLVRCGFETLADARSSTTGSADARSSTTGFADARSSTTGMAASTLAISGRWIGPTPETRRLTHSTCCVVSPSKS